MPGWTNDVGGSEEQDDDDEMTDDTSSGWGGSPVDSSAPDPDTDASSVTSSSDDGDDDETAEAAPDAHDDTSDDAEPHNAPDDAETTDDESSDVWGDDANDDDSETSTDTSDDEVVDDDTMPSISSATDIEEEVDEFESGGDTAQPASDGGMSEPPAPSNAITVNEAAEKERRWKILVWGPPKLFKTHLAYTMPEPIAFLDLESKADDLAHKFQGKNVRIWQVDEMTAEPDTKFRRARKALDEALEWLDWYREHKDTTGTIVVDSMSLMWEWAQTHHKLENYPLKDEGDIELSANFNNSQESDWGVVKEYHNAEFRERITDSPYHFCWTAMERVDFERTLDDDTDVQMMEPRGETNNEYKADTVLRARKENGVGKVGDLVGSNFTDNVFVGLHKPTFPKVKRAIEAIEEAEASDQPVDASSLAGEIEAQAIIDHDPQMFVE